MKGFPVRPVPVENVGVAAKAVARRQAEQLTVVRRRAQPTAVYIARLTATAVFAYLIAQALPGGSPRSVLAPLTALLVVQATLFNTIGTAIRRVAAVTVGVLAAVAVAAYVPFSWWVLGLLVAGTLALGIVLRLREEILEVPISAMLIFSVGSQAAASTRITETLVGAAAGLAAGLVFAPVRVQPAKEAVGELSRQMADLLGQMAEGLAEAPDPRRAAEWLDRTRALRGEIERVDDALSQAEESVRLNPRRLRSGDPAAGLRDGVDTLERAATDVRVLARSVADSARLDSEHSPVREAETPGWRPSSRSFPPRCGPTASCSRPSRWRPSMPRSRPSRSPRRSKTTSRRPSGSRTSSPTCSPPTRPDGRRGGSCAARFSPTWTGCAPSSSPPSCPSRPRPSRRCWPRR
jgi:uncharacterized membrane protein YgaE (UPF0421/DUF939 family)